MHPWKAGDRVHHASYGAGTVIEFNDQRAVVHFDVHGQRKFASHLVVLSASKQQAQAPQARRSGMTSERSTDVGYENLNEQTVVRVVRHEPREGAPTDARGASTYVLRCRRCGNEYGIGAADIQLRRCPACMGAPPGLPIQA